MQDVRSIIDDIFGGPTAFARAIGVAISAASEMKRRKSIPVKYWPTVMSAADDLGRNITSDDLVSAHTSEIAQ